MKTNVAWILILWLVLLLENARTDLILSQSLLIPSAVTCLFWLRNATGSLVTGTALVVSWLLHPLFTPLTPGLVLVMGTFLIVRGSQSSTWSPTVSAPSRHAWWAHPLFVCSCGLASHSILLADFQLVAAASAFTSRILPASAVLGILLFGLRAAEEFGWRRVPAA